MNTNIAHLKGVGSVLMRNLRRLGIETIGDLLHHFPFRYEDYSRTAAIKDLKEGQEVTIKVTIELIANKRSPRKRTMITEAVVSDGTDQLRVVWFGQPFIAKSLKVGDEVYFSGKVKEDMFGVQMVGPSYERVGKKETAHTARIVPIYPLTLGITEKQIRHLISQVISLADTLPEWLPEDMRTDANIDPLGKAMRAIHFPESQDDLRAAERRLKFDELFLLQLRSELARRSLQRLNAPPLFFHEEEIKAFVVSLPFTLTNAQRIATWEIFQDIEKEEPMNRLLEGDVGSGKTVVAGLVMYNTVLSKYQAALMVPTEILARQHFDSLCNLYKEKDVVIALMTRSQRLVCRAKENNDAEVLTKKKMIDFIKAGEANIIIGTHALLGESVSFQKLGLVIVDEQHRFGVEQRKTIREKSGMEARIPHFLSMTATPIPRSFALTLYGDLDLSIINELPKGRKPIKTRLVEAHNRGKAYEFIHDQVKQGRQVFVICPLIDDAESADKKSVLGEYEKLSQHIFPDLRVTYVHGKMKSEEKEETMKAFLHHEFDILVSTSVIEVGVNIPNATVMMIEGAERFGLAQLHQFRGRVGRSDHQSYCFLFTDAMSADVKKRLAFFESTTDGFKVAEYDLDMRGPGEVYGKSQSGMMQLRLATMKDIELIRLTRNIAKSVDFEKYPDLERRVAQWERRVHLE